MKKIKNLTGFPVEVGSFNRFTGEAEIIMIPPEEGVFGCTLPHQDPIDAFELGYSRRQGDNTALEVFIEHTGTLELLAEFKKAVEEENCYYLVDVDQYMAARRAGIDTKNFIFAELTCAQGISTLRFFDGEAAPPTRPSAHPTDTSQRAPKGHDERSSFQPHCH